MIPDLYAAANRLQIMPPPRPRTSNYAVAGGVLLVIGASFSLPALMRFAVPHQQNREKLTGSQRQRGMYMNAGAHDAGVDPDWDPKTQTRRNRRAEGRSAAEAADGGKQ